MESFAITVRYTEEVRADLVRHPSDRLKVVSPLVEQLGGKVKGAWLSMDPWDVLLIVEFPNYTAAAAVASVFRSGGLTQEVNLVPLVDIKHWIHDVITISPTYFNHLRDSSTKK